jgi:hypothetical protein
LFEFLEKNKHPITEDGKFIAYKKVANANSDGKYLDIYSHTFDNSPGQVISMDRNQVDEDPSQTCSSGLHVANWDYAANHYGSATDTMMEVEVDPADVVAVPTDYNQAKMRTCRYTVRGVVVNPNANKHLVYNPESPNTDCDSLCAEPECDKGYVECEYCEGSGEINICGEVESCDDCNGTGKLELLSCTDPVEDDKHDTNKEAASNNEEPKSEKCPECDGNGYYDCGDCDGSGEDYEEHECIFCDGEGTMECEICDGSGLAEDFDDDEDEDEDCKENSTNSHIIYHDETSMRKMSTDRLERYLERLDEYEYLHGYTLKTKECKQIALALLKSRGR